MLKWNDIIDTIREKKISVKVVTMAAALLVLTGLVGIRQSIPTSSTVGDRELPIYCVETQEPKIALTFDAAWGNEDTQKIMEILKKHNVKVTFFMTGGWVEHYPDDVKMILAEGHDLGNHSENHKNMSQLADSEKETELMKVHEKVKNLTGYEMFLFRPPYGDYDNAVVKTAKNAGITRFNGMWTLLTGRTMVLIPSSKLLQSTSIWETAPSSCATMVPNTLHRLWIP